MTNKMIIGIIVIIVLIGGGYYLSKRNTMAPTSVQNTPTQTMQAATSTYATSTFSLVYPSDYTVNPSYQDTNVVPSKPINGVSFTIPQSMATGTNLVADTYVSVETLPRAKECTGDIYLSANVKSQLWTDPVTNVQYSVASSSEGAAGSFYDETIYAFPGSSPCTAVRYFVHSSDIGNYPPGTVQPFDQRALMSAFDQIRQSIVLTQ